MRSVANRFVPVAPRPSRRAVKSTKSGDEAVMRRPEVVPSLFSRAALLRQEPAQMHRRCRG